MEWKKIESRNNPQVKYATALADKKARDREGVFCAEGVTLFSDFAALGFYPEKVYLSEEASFLKNQVEAALKEAETECLLLASHVFEKVTTEKGSQGIVSVYDRRKLSDHLSLKHFRRLVALEKIQDPGNVGTIIRSAASFGFDGVLLVDCADPFGPKAVRASMGAVAHIPTVIFSSTALAFDFLKEKKVRSVAACLTESARSITETDLKAPVCVWIGNEGKGLSSEAIASCDCASIIPIEKTESLNAAAAAAIFLWEVKKEGEAF